ncbi:replication-associated recombination protein A [Kocuria palustris]|uniref:replication-associated recombination protein A n=1 Tax=Kocuria palustris TaxID=71999 RepID=UPI003CF118BA
MSDHQPLAARMRPRSLDEIVGQGHLIFDGSLLHQLVAGKLSTSVLLYGPPGTGKTTIASVIAATTSSRFVELSATSATVKDVRRVLAEASNAMHDRDLHTLVFLDEIHRFTKAQQDILLPAVEAGTISLIGATTENPSFSVNSALVSRSILLVLKALDEHSIRQLLRAALRDPRGLDNQLSIEEPALEKIATLASGDTRQALNRLETAAMAAQAAGTEITVEIVDVVTGAATQRYDRDGDQHYDIISAFIKSMRGSDPDATLYWLARMIEAGEDPRFIARRLIVHASEDVGMADPTVLPLAVAAAQAVQLIGLPEARINLAHAALAVALAPKSPAVIAGINAAQQAVAGGATGTVPVHLRDAHYPGAAALGHGAGYLYPHDYPRAVVAQQYLPDDLDGSVAGRFYSPSANGREADIAEILRLRRALAEASRSSS